MLGAFAPFFGLYLKNLGFSSLEIGVLLAIMPVVRTALPTAVGLDRRPPWPPARADPC